MNETTSSMSKEAGFQPTKTTRGGAAAVDRTMRAATTSIGHASNTAVPGRAEKRQGSWPTYDPGALCTR